MIVFANGVFDLLHAGHVDLLVQCREIAGPGGLVVVGLNSDASVARLKPGRPIICQTDRMRCLLALRSVDQVFIFNTEAELLELIRAVKPGVIVKGAEWRGKVVRGESVCPVRFVERRVSVSTTEIVEKIERIRGLK